MAPGGLRPEAEDWTPHGVETCGDDAFSSPRARSSGHADYVISKAALNYMNRRCLARPVISHLAA
jgi:hypothetical protein